MRVPVSWLGEVVDLPEDVTLEHLHEALVRVGFEEEAVHAFGVTGPILAGRVLERTPEPQSNGKTINWCQVDVGALGADPAAAGGERDVRGIVCGAHNFEAGDLVAVTLPGAVLPGPTPDEPFRIAARKTYGHVSDGMIASERELGLGDEHGGIIVLTRRGIDVPPGTDLIPILGLADAAVEINVTPDRGYALSIRGVGREYSHATGAAYRDPALEPGLQARADAAHRALSEAEGRVEGFPLAVRDDAPIRGRVGCDGFVARIVRGVDITRPTPPWMVARLRLAGIRSISLPVDITNYVMLEFGQPTHGYDLATLRGGITVRRARSGERLTTLDGQDRALHPEDLLITDESGPIGLAGVMGGGPTEITDATTDILIEAAHFDAVSIARTARRHKLWSEASKRYERGVDPAVGRAAAQRVVDLLVEFAGGVADDAAGGLLEQPHESASIELPAGYVDGLVGADYTDDEIAGALRAIGCEVSANGSLSERSESKGALVVNPPTWRPDLRTKADLAEEVARVVGYDRIPAALPVAPPGRGLTDSQRLRRAAAASLAGSGLVEVLSYPFASEVEAERWTPGRPAMRLANALDGAAPCLRTSLWPGLVAAARRNLSRGLTDLALFEIGRVFLPEVGTTYGSDALPVGGERPSDDLLRGLYASVPPQPWHVGAIFLGDRVPRQPGVAAVHSGIADAVSSARHLALALGASLEVAQGVHPSLHPGRAASLSIAGQHVGWAGEILPSLAGELDLPRVVAVLELDLDALITAVAPAGTAPISGFPAATQDVTLVTPVGTVVGELLAAFVDGAGSLLEEAHLVDDYRGEGVPEGAKALTFSLRFRAPDRTLTQAEATEAKLAGVAAVAGAFGATIRE
ncbi:MAG TPA: phenylalanine--tRNA ligase subunit beta [Microbacteriaceae bacterium]|nr:phenylalanine--tRNA ligase subunit beta [Microbacteriaceae bacterium]